MLQLFILVIQLHIFMEVFEGMGYLKSVSCLFDILGTEMGRSSACSRKSF